MIAENRHHLQRIINRVKNYYPDCNQRYFKLNAITRKRCSASCCGNPRKYFKELTMQEKRGLNSYSDQLKDVA